jgi:hypothetical protein
MEAEVKRQQDIEAKLAKEKKQRNFKHKASHIIQHSPNMVTICDLLFLMSTHTQVQTLNMN